MTILCIFFIDKWLTNNNPLAMEINNKSGGVMCLNADGKQHIAQPPQPSSNKLLEKNNVVETKNSITINVSNKEISQTDQDITEKIKESYLMRCQKI
ncbi:hypothetical protein [Candidatus Kinetoplastidibacterium galati]|nr:hypothetical protein [Candidatus Kinetoplastibacterium galatii]